MGVPPWNVVDLEAFHQLPAVQEVLEDLVHGMPDVQVAVRVGGTVVEREGGSGGGATGGGELVVDKFFQNSLRGAVSEVCRLQGCGREGWVSVFYDAAANRECQRE